MESAENLSTINKIMSIIDIITSMVINIVLVILNLRGSIWSMEVLGYFEFSKVVFLASSVDLSSRSNSA